MRKVIGIFLSMLFVFIIANLTFAEENPTNLEWNEVLKMVDEWTMINRKPEYTGGGILDENYCFYGTGVLSNNECKEMTGSEYSEEMLIDFYLNNEEYQNIYDVYEANIKIVGFYENFKVYELHLKANNKLGTYMNIKFNEAVVIFMVCK